MRAVVQRVRHARVTVEGEKTGAIGEGLLVFLGVHPDDTEATATSLAARITGLRIFEDAGGKMNLALAESGGSLLCVSQFTLYGDVRRGRRPSFAEAAPPDQGERLYEAFCRAVEAAGFVCARGRFGAHMAVELLNDGPVTFILDTHDLERPRRA